MRTQIHRFFPNDPADVRDLEEAISSGQIDPKAIVAIIGKTEGNGATNDFSRGLAIMAHGQLLGPLLGCAAEEMEDRVVFSFSGGTEGVTCPHYLVFTVDEFNAGEDEYGLALVVGRTRVFTPEETGRMAMVLETARVVQELMTRIGVRSQDVHLVQVKAAIPPLPLCCDDAQRQNYRCNMAWSRGASALGVGLGLGEIPETVLHDQMINRDWCYFSTRASVSAKPTLLRSEVCLFANASGWVSENRIAHGVMQDILDVGSIYNVLQQLDMHPINGQLPTAESDRLLAVFAKSDADPRGTVRKRRHTMYSDGDISDMRHSRSVVSSILAGVLGETAVYVSTRAEHQGPLGGGPVAIIAKSV